MAAFTRQCIPEKTKRVVAASQKWRCAACNRLLSAHFEIDHGLALSLGGSNSRRNLQALCPCCHRAKTHGDMQRLHTHFGKNFCMLFLVGGEEVRFKGVVLKEVTSGYSVLFEDEDQMVVPFKKAADAATWVWL